MPPAPGSPHPSPDQLSAFSLGKLSEAEVEAIGQHLEYCQACKDAVQEAPGDSFVAQLQAAFLGTNSIGQRKFE
jgi:anti-sigma factor ChrR (cupin superfamily)